MCIFSRIVALYLFFFLFEFAHLLLMNGQVVIQKLGGQDIDLQLIFAENAHFME